MKSLMMLWRVVAEEFGGRCSVSTTRDYEYVSSRVKHEGLSYLAITLPAFGSDFQKSLALGEVAPDAFLGFRTRRTGLPLFLRGFLELVFDRGTGVLLDEPNIEAIHAVRQLTMLFGKVEVSTSAKRERLAMEGFVECEREVKRVDSARTMDETSEFRQVSTLLWGDVLSRVTNDLYAEITGHQGSDDPNWPYVIPKHGPGATADRLRGNAKFDLVEWPQRLEDVFPFGEYAIPNWRYRYRLDRVDYLEPGAERPVRVIAVPKTLKTPRIIAIEPTAMQYMQQGISSMLVDRIRGDHTMGKMVGFDDQWRNHRLVEKGSRDGSYASLDLSEASDRVSNQLVRAMLAPFPLLQEAVDATRSRKADVRGHGVIRLAKYASMGSALTFPIEAMVFMTCVFVGLQRSEGRRLTPSDIKSMRGQVRVYGDDIIVPADIAKSVMYTLESFGFKVNHKKSYWTGKFRESCGKEYFDGHDVSVVRCRSIVFENGAYELPSSRRYVSQTESTVALRNRFYLSGLWQTAAWLDEWNHQLLGGWYPTVEVTRIDPWEDPSPRSDVLSRWSVLPYSFLYREGELEEHQHYHAPLATGWVVQNRIPLSAVSGEGALMKVLYPRKVEPFQDPQHLTRAGRPEASRMKLRKVII